MSKQTHTPIPDLDDDDQPFYQDAYLRKLGFSPEEPSRTSPPGLSFYPTESMIETLPASQWITRGRPTRLGSRELFGPLWREGEVAVLFGASSAGKSLLAVHIADSISRGRPSASSPPCLGGVAGFSSPPGLRRGADASSVGWSADGVVVRPKPQKVLLFDFELSAQQFSDRYTAPSPIPGKLPIRRPFKFHRAAINWDGQIPPEFKGNITEYLWHSINQQIETTGARVIIIDNISYLVPGLANGTACTRAMKTLKLWAATRGLSILLIAHMKGSRLRRSDYAGRCNSSNPQSAIRDPQSTGRPITLNDLAGSRAIHELADSVFAIAHSTYGPAFRYVKHLKSRTAAPISDQDDVLTYHIGPIPSSNPRSAIGDPQSELSLTYLGPSAESDHLRDYAREALEAERREQEALRKLRSRSSRSALIDGILDGSYTRYLKE